MTFQGNINGCFHVLWFIQVVKVLPYGRQGPTSLSGRVSLCRPLDIDTSISKQFGLILVWSHVVLSTITITKSTAAYCRLPPALLKPCCISYNDNCFLRRKRNLLGIHLRNYNYSGHPHRFSNCISLITTRHFHGSDLGSLLAITNTYWSICLGYADVWNKDKSSQIWYAIAS